MSNTFIKTIDKFMPERILNNSDLSMHDLIRCRVFVCILLSTFLMSALIAIAFILARTFSTHDFVPAIVAGLLGALGSFSLGIFFKATGHIQASTLLFSTIFLLVIIISIVISGGPRATSMPILISCPVIAALTGGRNEGIYNAFLVLMVGSILVFLESMGFQFYELSPTQDYNALFFASWVSAILLNMSCLYIYQYLHEELG